MYRYQNFICVGNSICERSSDRCATSRDRRDHSLRHALQSFHNGQHNQRLQTGPAISIFVNLMFPEKKTRNNYRNIQFCSYFFNDHIFRLQFLSRYSSIVNNLNIKYLTKYIYIYLRIQQNI